MPKFIQIAATSDAGGDNRIFALDDAGRVYYTFWKDNKWQNWKQLPLHPNKQKGV